MISGPFRPQAARQYARKFYSNYFGQTNFRGCKAEIFKRSLSNTINDEKKKFLDAAYNKAKEQAKPKNNPNQKFVVFGSTIGITALVSFSIYKLASQKLSDAKESGDWNLVDFDGKPASNKDLEGHWIIYYFGFTQCPDICPEEMAKIAKMNDILSIFEINL
ncbi:MAG: Cu-binding protein [Paramarteilia canceri]